ncbi:transposase [Paenibacillus sp. FSL R7-0198]|uniref:transposase n=1 Tax=Paenibacillus sp. FSL R7-0198 TaxID=2921674 RepID=UPI0030F895F4
MVRLKQVQRDEEVFKCAKKIFHRQVLRKVHVLWAVRSGAPWRDLPEHYGSWKTVYTRFRRWQISGIWDEILKHVSTTLDFENIMIDATIVRVHQHGAGAKGGSNFRRSSDP